MIKHVPEDLTVTFSEIPDEICCCFNLSGCCLNCVGCHSPYLRKDIGEELTPELIDSYIAKNAGISCVCFMGEGNDRETLLNLARYVKDTHPELMVGIYSGRESVEDEYFDIFDYVKIGPYIEKYGPLNKPTTNQRMYFHREDITYKFWARGLVPSSPAKYILNPNREHVLSIREALSRNKVLFDKEYCPCILPKYYSESSVCPCEEYRTTGKCRCKLYKE